MKTWLLTLALVSGVAFADCGDQKQQRPGDQKDCDKQEQQQQQKQEVTEQAPVEQMEQAPVEQIEQAEQSEQAELGQVLPNHHRWICFASDQRGRTYRGRDRDRFDARRKALQACRHGHHHRCRLIGCRREQHH